MRNLLTLYQIAEQTGLPQRWLRQEALNGRLPCLRVGRMLRFNLVAIEEALARRAAAESIANRAESVKVREQTDVHTKSHQALGNQVTGSK